jgi:phosphate/phosphite/phosphonate ABC transporter binding protein
MALRCSTGPVFLDEDGDELRTELGAALGTALGEPVEVRAEASYAALLERVLAGETALAWVPPAIFVRAHAAGVLPALLRAERAGGDHYRSAIFVRSDGPIERPLDLRGKRMAWVDRHSCAGYLFPRLALRRAGIDPKTCFSSEIFFASHARVVHAVLTGTADAGATFVQLDDRSDPERGLALAGWTAWAPPRSMRPVLVSDPIPSDAIGIGISVPPGRREEIRDVLAHFHERPVGLRLLRALLGAERLVPASADDYAPVRAALESEEMPA